MKKFMLIFAIVAALGMVFTGCGKSDGDNADVKTETKQGEAAKGESVGEVEKISPEKAKELIETDEAPVILDVRSFEEFEKEHIEDAICFPATAIGESITGFLPNKTQLILVYGDSQNQTEEATEKLADLGYTNVKDFGELKDWEYGTKSENN